MGFFYNKFRRARRRHKRLLAYASQLAAAYGADAEAASISMSAIEDGNTEAEGGDAEGGGSGGGRILGIVRMVFIPHVVMLPPQPIVFGVMITLSFLGTFINMAEQIFLAFLGDWVGERAWATEGENWGVSSDEDNLFWLNVGFGLVLTADDFKCVILDYLPEELPLLELAVTFTVTFLQMGYLPYYWSQNGGEMRSVRTPYIASAAPWTTRSRSHRAFPRTPPRRHARTRARTQRDPVVLLVGRYSVGARERATELWPEPLRAHRPERRRERTKSEGRRRAHKGDSRDRFERRRDDLAHGARQWHQKVASAAP